MSMRLFKNKWFRIGSIATTVALTAALLFNLFLPVTVSPRINFLGFEVSKVEAAATITSLGVNSDKTPAIFFTGDLNPGSVGDVLIFVVAADSALTTSNVKYQHDGAGGYQVFENLDVEANNSGNVWVGIFRSDPLTVTTLYRRAQVAAAGGTARSATLYVITGLDTTPFDKSNSGTGNGTDANTGTTATLTQADEVVIGASGVEDEVDDAHGTWTTGASYVSGNEQFAATNGGGDASNIQVHSVAEIVSATTAQQGDDTGHDSTDWAAAIATYKVSGTSPDFTNAPTSIAFGTVATSAQLWSNGSAPTFPLDDGECYFTVTSTSSASIDIVIKATNFTGGVGWTLASSPGSNIVTLKAGVSGDANEAAMIVLTTSDQAFITTLTTLATKKWELHMETPTAHTDGVLKTSTITLTASLS